MSVVVVVVVVVFCLRNSVALFHVCMCVVAVICD